MLLPLLICKLQIFELSHLMFQWLALSEKFWFSNVPLELMLYYHFLVFLLKYLPMVRLQGTSWSPDCRYGILFHIISPKNSLSYAKKMNCDLNDHIWCLYCWLYKGSKHLIGINEMNCNNVIEIDLIVANGKNVNISLHSCVAINDRTKKKDYIFVLNFIHLISMQFVTCSLI